MKDFTTNLPKLKTAIVADYSRIQKDIYAQQQKLERMQEFLMRRTMKLEAAATAIEKFLEAHKLVLPKYSNAYSTGWDNGEYAAEAHMLIECNAVFTQGIKNMSLWRARLEQHWNENIKVEYGIALDRAMPGDAGAELKLRVYP